MTPHDEVMLMRYISDLHDTVNGNGDPGLVRRVTRLETKMAFVIWIGSVAGGTLVGAFTTAMFTGVFESGVTP